MSPVFVGSTSVSKWSPSFTPGPEWRSFETFRKSGPTVIEGIAVGTVGTLQIKSSKFRILREDDFQNLLGLASEVHRIRQGITLVVQAAKVVAKHPDQESIKMFFQSASLLSESSLLPVRDGHDSFRVSPEDAAKYPVDDDLRGIRASEIRRPKL